MLDRYAEQRARAARPEGDRSPEPGPPTAPHPPADLARCARELTMDELGCAMRSGYADELEGAEDFTNRLQKNMQALKKWAVKENIYCLRLYDADLPDFNVAVDLYGDRLHVQEYAPPKTIDPEKAKKRFK